LFAVAFQGKHLPVAAADLENIAVTEPFEGFWWGAEEISILVSNLADASADIVWNTVLFVELVLPANEDVIGKTREQGPDKPLFFGHQKRNAVFFCQPSCLTIMIRMMVRADQPTWFL